MTMTTTTPYNGPYSGDGANDIFPFTFKILAEDQLKVTLVATATGVETAQTKGVDYNVQQNSVGLAAGGSIRFTTAPAVGYQIVIRLDPSITQSTNIKNESPYAAISVENALDRATMVEQKLQYQIDKCIKGKETEIPAAGDFTLPSVVDRKGKTLLFNATTGLPEAGNSIDTAVTEGTFTPTLGGATTPGSQTYVLQLGKYVKIGKLVFIQGVVQISAKGGGPSGTAIIGGLPFVMASTASHRNPICIASASGITFTTGGTIQMAAFMKATEQFIRLDSLLAGGNHLEIGINDVANASQIAFAGCYLTN